ncbi:MAG TPA: DciA family protein [Terriglobales bacterium]
MERVRVDIQKFAANLLQNFPPEDAVVLAWPLVCGSGVAQRTKALDFSSGILRVQVPDAGWCGQLSDFSRQYIASINAIVRQKVLKRIEYVRSESDSAGMERVR